MWCYVAPIRIYSDSKSRFCQIFGPIWHSTGLLWVTPSNLWTMYVLKLDSWGYRVAKTQLSHVQPFGYNPSVWQRDGQTSVPITCLQQLAASAHNKRMNSKKHRFSLFRNTFTASWLQRSSKWYATLSCACTGHHVTTTFLHSAQYK